MYFSVSLKFFTLNKGPQYIFVYFSSFAGNTTIITDKFFLTFKPYKHISWVYITLKRIGFVDLLVIVKVALGVNIPMKLFEMYSNSRYFPGLNKYNIGEHCKIA